MLRSRARAWSAGRWIDAAADFNIMLEAFRRRVARDESRVVGEGAGSDAYDQSQSIPFHLADQSVRSDRSVDRSIHLGQFKTVCIHLLCLSGSDDARARLQLLDAVCPADARPATHCRSRSSAAGLRCATYCVPSIADSVEREGSSGGSHRLRVEPPGAITASCCTCTRLPDLRLDVALGLGVRMSTRARS